MDSVIGGVNREAAGDHGIFKQDMNQQGGMSANSNRSLLGENDIENTRLMGIGQLLASQHNMAMNNAMTVMPGQRAQDAAGLMGIGDYGLRTTTPRAQRPFLYDALALHQRFMVANPVLTDGSADELPNALVEEKIALEIPVILAEVKTYEELIAKAKFVHAEVFGNLQGVEDCKPDYPKHAGHHDLADWAILRDVIKLAVTEPVAAPAGFSIDALSEPLEDATALVAVMENGAGRLDEGNMACLAREAGKKLAALHEEYTRLADVLYQGRKRA